MRFYALKPPTFEATFPIRRGSQIPPKKSNLQSNKTNQHTFKLLEIQIKIAELFNQKHCQTNPKLNGTCNRELTRHCRRRKTRRWSYPGFRAIQITSRL